MKKIIALIAGSLVTTSGLIHAATANFSFLNKNKQPITLTVKHGVKPYITDEPVQPAGSDLFSKKTYDATLALDPRINTYLIIKDYLGQCFGYRIEAGSKTIYVSYETKLGQTDLHPQSGMLGGLAGKTTRGYSLSNNVKQTDIFPIDCPK
jgi:hypothetical protein